MASMEQIEYMQREARKMGIKWSEWREKYGHTLPKPDPTPRREVEWWQGLGRWNPKPREGIKVVCECGATFTAKRKDAQYCPRCKKERTRLSLKRNRERKQNAKIQKQKDHC